MSDAAKEAALVERLLGELQAMVSPLAWQKIEQLVRALCELQGAGFQRMLQHAAATGAGDEFAERLAGDDLVAGLLALHGLHPLDAAARVRRALAALPRETATVELLGIEEGRAHLRVASAAPREIAGALERLVIDVAPELTGVTFESITVEAAPRLVQIDLARSRSRG